jgi:hypothetical protein
MERRARLIVNGWAFRRRDTASDEENDGGQIWLIAASP